MQSAPNSVGPSRSNVQDDLQKSRSSTLPQKNTVMSFVKKDPTRTMSAAANTNPVSSVPSFDERVLRNIGLSSCSKVSYYKTSLIFLLGQHTTHRLLHFQSDCMILLQMWHDSLCDENLYRNLIFKAIINISKNKLNHHVCHCLLWVLFLLNVTLLYNILAQK